MTNHPKHQPEGFETKSYRLHVAMTPTERESLARAVLLSGSDETISDFVRDAISRRVSTVIKRKGGAA